MSDRPESGFTLVEVLIATVISAIIIGGIAGIMIVTLRSYPQSATRLTVSDNAQLLSSYLVPDVQSADGGTAGINTDPDTPNDLAVCFAPPGVPTDNVLSITWTDFATGGLFRIDYCQVGTDIVRFYRQPGIGSVQTVVSRDVAPMTPAKNGMVATLTVDSVNVAVTTLADGGPYVFNVTATRRTPALRIWPAPIVNLANVGHVAVSGTVPGALPVSVSITDQANHTVNANVSGNGTWTKSVNLSTLSDGIITFTASATIDGHPAQATTTAVKDTTPPSATATVVSATPWTATAPVTFLLTFSEPVTAPVFTTTPQQQALLVTVPSGNSPGKTVSATPCPGNAAAGSQCFNVLIAGMDTSDDAGDGAVSVQIPAGAVTDTAGNPNTASPAPAATNWDANPPIVTVTASSPSPTSTDGLVFLAAVSKVTTDQLKASDVTAVPPGPGAPPLTIAIGACPPTGNPPPECFAITLTNLKSVDNAGGPVTVTVKAGAITDNFGRPTTVPSTSPAITWTPLTIHENGPPTAAKFNGVAGPGTVTVNRCADAACATNTLIQAVNVNSDGTWGSQPADLTTDTYAEVVQNLNGVITTVIIPVP